MKNPRFSRFTCLLRWLPCWLAAIWLTTMPATHAAESGRQDLAVLQQLAAQFLRSQTIGLPGDIQVSVDHFDTRLNLATCPTPQPFLPNGSRAWGNTTVGVRCTAPNTWAVYVAAQVRVLAPYVAVATPLAQGQVLDAASITVLKGDLGTLPAGIITDPARAIGRSAVRALPAGTPLRDDSLRSQQAIRAGQTIRLLAIGPGFSISSEGRAIGNANEGQIARARTASGDTVSGVAQAGGVLEIRY